MLLEGGGLTFAGESRKFKKKERRVWSTRLKKGIQGGGKLNPWKKRSSSVQRPSNYAKGTSGLSPQENRSNQVSDGRRGGGSRREKTREGGQQQLGGGKKKKESHYKKIRGKGVTERRKGVWGEMGPNR